jgi:uncharacterized protein YkwD
MKITFISSMLIATTLSYGAYGDKFERADSANNPAMNLANTTTNSNVSQTYTPKVQKIKVSIKDATLKAINKIRTQNQFCAKATRPLIWNEGLYRVTKEHTIDMAANSMLKHDGSGRETDITAKNLGLNRGSHFYERVNQKEDSKKILSGELVVSVSLDSYQTPKEVLNYWINRPNDCKVIMDPRFSDVALSKVINRKTSRAYWTLMLAGRNKK